MSASLQRARINSAIFVSSEGRGFDSIEFIRRYGSQSVLCRKAKSAGKYLHSLLLIKWVEIKLDTEFFF